MNSDFARIITLQRKEGGLNGESAETLEKFRYI